MTHIALGIDNWVCWCHNSPMYIFYGKGKSLRRECPIELNASDIVRLRKSEDSKWFVAESGALLENQGIWSGDLVEKVPPFANAQRVGQEELTYYVHMYIHQFEKPSLRSINNGLFVDDGSVWIQLERNYIQPYGRDAKVRRVRDNHLFPKRNHGMRRLPFTYVRTFINYIPAPEEVQKAEYDWLHRRVSRDYNELVMEQTGVKGMVDLT